MKNKAIIKQGQTFLDKVLQHSGSMEAAVEMAVLNGVSITDDLALGQVLSTPAALNPRTVNLWTEGKREPATAIDHSVILEKEGIDYWFLQEYEIQ